MLPPSGDSSGFPARYRLEDPKEIIASVQKLLKTRRNVELNVPVTEVEIPADLNDDEKVLRQRD